MHNHVINLVTLASGRTAKRQRTIASMDKVALVSALLVRVFDKFSAVGLEVVESSP